MEKTRIEVLEMMLNDEAINKNEDFKNYVVHEIEIANNKQEQARKKRIEDKLEFRNKILSILKNSEKSMTPKELAEALKCSPQKVQSNVKYLKDYGIKSGHNLRDDNKVLVVYYYEEN